MNGAVHRDSNLVVFFLSPNSQNVQFWSAQKADTEAFFLLTVLVRSLLRSLRRCRSRSHDALPVQREPFDAVEEVRGASFLGGARIGAHARNTEECDAGEHLDAA